MKVDPREAWGCRFTISVEISNMDQVTPSTTATQQDPQQAANSEDPQNLGEFHSLNSDAV